MSIQSIAEFLEACGPWGVCAVLFLAIAYMYRSTNNLLEARNNQLVETLQETTAALQEAATALQANTRQFERVRDVLIRIEHDLNINPGP